MARVSSIRGRLSHLPQIAGGGSGLSVGAGGKFRSLWNGERPWGETFNQKDKLVRLGSRKKKKRPRGGFTDPMKYSDTGKEKGSSRGKVGLSTYYTYRGGRIYWN